MLGENKSRERVVAIISRRMQEAVAKIKDLT
jgi:hypothetical protein